MMKNFIALFFLTSLLVQCKPKEDNTITQFSGKPEVPATIMKEHTHLLDEINNLALLEDSTGRVALKLKELMTHHFREEEDYVLPPLGLLQMLAKGEVPLQADEIISLTEKLKSQSDHMLAEHQLIKAFLDEMMQIAAVEDHPEVSSLAEQIEKHALTEQEVYFPAAILVGEYLKIK